MKRSEVMYSQLDQLVRSLGFLYHASKKEPPGHIYQHPKTGAMVLLTPYRPSEKVFEYHLITVRTELDHFGIADPTTFAAKLQKTG